MTSEISIITEFINMNASTKIFNDLSRGYNINLCDIMMSQTHSVKLVVDSIHFYYYGDDDAYYVRPIKPREERMVGSVRIGGAKVLVCSKTEGLFIRLNRLTLGADSDLGFKAENPIVFQRIHRSLKDSNALPL
jgi:hypothetical protein